MGEDALKLAHDKQNIPGSDDVRMLKMITGGSGQSPRILSVNE